MKSGDGILLLAGVAGVGSLLVGAAALTTALIAGAGPAVLPSLDAAQNAQGGAWAGGLWILPGMTCWHRCGTSPR